MKDCGLQTRSFIQLSLLASLLCLARKAECAVNYLVIFGDDYVDTGNNKYFRSSSPKCGIPPYGMSQAVANGRCSNGALFVDQMAKQFKLKPPGPSMGPEAGKSNGVSFAFTGAGALNSTNPNSTISLDGQWDMFKTWVDSARGGVNLTGSFVVISFGMNDYIQAILNNEDPVPLTDQIVPKIAKLMTDIQSKTGAYRFIVVSPPPIGCLPLLRQRYQAATNSCLTNLNALNENHDSRIQIILDGLVTAQPNGGPMYYTRFSLNTLFLNPKMGFLVFSKTWEVACGVVDTTTGRIYNCGELVHYIDQETGKEAAANVGPAKLVGWDFWWWDWLNPSQDAHYIMWVSLWVKAEVTYPRKATDLFAL